MILLETARLLLRRFRPSDLDPFAKLCADPEVTAFFPKASDRAETAAFIQRIDDHFDEHGFGLCAVELKGVAPCIGMVGLWRPRFVAPITPCIEIGWRLAREHWGHGYVHEAARACLQFGFEQLGADEVVSFTVLANRRSWAVMERLGMKRDASADFEHPNVPEGSPLRPHIVYRMKRADYR